MARKESLRISAAPVSEGVRFEIGDTAACAVRNERRDIAVHVRRRTRRFSGFVSRIPLVRGVARLIGCIARFFSGMNEAARLRPQQAVRGGKRLRKFAELFRTTPQSLYALLSGLTIPAILAVLAFGLPEAVEAGLMLIPDLPRFAVNAVCCAFRIAGVLASIYLICRLRVIDRLCMYRGAAGKVINAFESYGENLTHEEALLSSRLTDESDGAFLLTVMIVSMIAFACVRTDALWLQLTFRLSVILAAAAVCGEIVRPLEHAGSDGFAAALRRPLTMLQQLFTIEPNNQMIEVAVCAFKAARDRERT